MSERMNPLSFAELMESLLREYREQGSVFGVRQLYRADGPELTLFGERLETPVGPAAGPHTQMAQNILSAYAAGARFFEVKTVQRMDGEEMVKCIPRPCIRAEDEGYNVEWSTELTVPQALAEYIKAWFAMKLISVEFSLGDPDGFMINMSVGYDLEGIRTPKVDAYIEGMKDASGTDVWRECVSWALDHADWFENLDETYIRQISPKVCTSITLSTLHGCPPEEIERIATYLILEKHLNTFIKCNPTLLGYGFARSLLDRMGYDYLVFDRHHFEADLQYEDAVPMLKRLQALADEEEVAFGVKLTNTFPVEIRRGELPGTEMYMSGRALYPLSLSLAAKLEQDFGGRLRVSFSGGADAFNVRSLVKCGIWPVTVATTLLKPGGYNRLRQIAIAAGIPGEWSGVNVEKLTALADSVATDPHYLKPLKELPRPRASRKAPLRDCFLAGCRETCPIRQDIPAYLERVAEGDWPGAMEIICDRNPLPHITGKICAHFCQSACTRVFYEEPVQIRDMKYQAAVHGFEDYLATLPVPEKAGPKIAVIGGGPAGMAAAFFAARKGARVTLFEKTGVLGGVVRHVIPAFRIPPEDIDQDARLLEKLGVTLRLNIEIHSESELEGFDHILLAVGAEKHGTLRLEEGEAMNAIDFLRAAKQAPDSLFPASGTPMPASSPASGTPDLLSSPAPSPRPLSPGRSVTVIGGGNTAMDAARAAKRLPGVEEVRIVYRRTVRQMPADEEELKLAGAEGIRFMELLAPEKWHNGVLTCQLMRLGPPDPDGRSSPEPTGLRTELPATLLVAAIGEKADTALISRFPNARVIGDARRGPATVVEAIADALDAVSSLLGGIGSRFDPESPADTYRPRRAVLCDNCDEDDASRCLGCSTVCESCVDVCPNRANVIRSIRGKPFILHLDRLCNECGNCAMFCPYDGKPFRDKWTRFETREALEASPENQGYAPLPDNRLLIRLDGEVFETDPTDPRLSDLWLGD